MNLLQSPPAPFPGADEPSPEVFRPRNFSLNNAPPAYHAERAPPGYQDATEAESGEKNGGRRRGIRRTMVIRIMTSVVVVTTIALIVGGVSSKIDTMKGNDHHGDADYTSTLQQDGATATDAPKIVIVSDSPMTTAEPATATTEEPSESLIYVPTTLSTMPSAAKEKTEDIASSTEVQKQRPKPTNTEEGPDDDPPGRSKEENSPSETAKSDNVDSN